MNKKYIIFDFDGTLVNTNTIITDSWQATLRHYLGHELPQRVIEATFGEVLAESMERLIPGVDVDEAIAYYRAYQDANQNDDIVYVFDGIRETLEELRDRGCYIGIGTSRTAYSLHNYLKMMGIDTLVDEIVTMNDVTHHKPHPDTVEAALLKLIARDKEDRISDKARAAAIMIGDTKYDVGCAQNAGVDSVLVGWSHYIDEDDMAECGFEPTYRIERPEEILEIAGGRKE